MGKSIDNIFNILPNEIICIILSYLCDTDRFSFYKTCKKNNKFRQMMYYDDKLTIIRIVPKKKLNPKYKNVHVKLPHDDYFDHVDQLSHVKKVTLYNNKIKNQNIKYPDELTHLTFDKQYNNYIDFSLLPSSLVYLDIPSLSLQYFLNPHLLPHQLISLTLSNVNQEIINVLKELRLNYLCINHIDEKINIDDKFPSTLKVMNIGINNMLTENVFPEGLKMLHLNYYCNKSINKNVFPKSLSTLNFSSTYMITMNENVLPEGLKILKILTYNHDIDNNYITIYKNTLPSTLQHLDIHYKCSFHFEKDALPLSLEKLNLGKYYDQVITEGILPPFLTELHFDPTYSQKIDTSLLPVTLISLKLGTSFHPIPNKDRLPCLKYLHLGDSFDQVIDKNIFPDTLKEINFGKNYNQPIFPDVLPNSIIILHFYKKFNYSLDGLLPTSLKCLIIKNKTYSHKIKQWPTQLNILKINLEYQNIKLLPISIKALHIIDKFDLTKINTMYLPNLEILRYEKSENNYVFDKNHQFPLLKKIIIEQ